MNRRIAAAVLLLFYGGVALLGPEVHTLVCDDEHDRESNAASLIGDKSTSGFSKSAVRSPGHDEENCSVCKLLSMPQAAAIAAAQEQAVEKSCNHIELPCTSPDAKQDTAFLIRGPPQHAV